MVVILFLKQLVIISVSTGGLTTLYGKIVPGWRERGSESDNRGGGAVETYEDKKTWTDS